VGNGFFVSFVLPPPNAPPKEDECPRDNERRSEVQEKEAEIQWGCIALKVIEKVREDYDGLLKRRWGNPQPAISNDHKRDARDDRIHAEARFVWKLIQGF
jgi:hypothetical protein